MAILKVTKDYLSKGTFRLITKYFLGKEYIPVGLYELSEYFRNHGAINFESHQEDGEYVAVSTNFIFGSIITYGKDKKQLDANIKDAILTSFDVPSSYSQEASIVKVDEEKYALA